MASDETTRSTSEPEPHRRRSGLFNWPPGYLLLWILTVVSLIVNIVLIRSLLLARRIAVQSVHDSIEVLNGLQHQVINYNVVVDQNLPVKADIPIHTTVPVVIKDTLPINTTVTVTVPGLGIPVPIPISTTVPIDKQFNITIDKTFPLETEIPVHFEVPIVFAIEQSGLYATLEETKARLVILESSLNAPLLPFLPGLNTPDLSPPELPPSPSGGPLPTPTAGATIGVTTTP